MARERKLYFACNFDYTGTINPFTGAAIMNGGKAFFAMVLSCGANDNLLNRFEHYSGLITMNYAPTKKAAQQLCDEWNEAYKKNGTYCM